MIEVKHLEKTYGSGDLEVKVLKDLSFTIDSGEFVAIIGPSGAGKSTLLYQISLLDEPTRGDIVINGTNVTEMSMIKKVDFRLNELGYIFQDYALLPELTALENVSLPLMMSGHTKKSCEHIAKNALNKVGLKDKYNNVPSRLSGGQQQRVSIARAIAHEPKILFADEPTANLDSENSHLVMESFMELYKAGQTIVMVTHEEEYAHRAGRVIELRDGVIVKDTKHTRT